jgi:hypothetical protein
MEKFIVVRRALKPGESGHVMGTVFRDGTVKNEPGQDLKDLVSRFLKPGQLNLSVDEDWEYLKGRFSRAMQTYIVEDNVLEE